MGIKGDSFGRADMINTHAALVAGLNKIYRDNEAGCGCECDTKTCCNRVGEPCAKCDARAALAKVNAPKQEKWSNERSG